MDFVKIDTAYGELLGSNSASNITRDETKGLWDKMINDPLFSDEKEMPKSVSSAFDSLILQMDLIAPYFLARGYLGVSNSDPNRSLFLKDPLFKYNEFKTLEEVYILDSDFYDDSYFYEYVESYWNTLITFRDLTYTDEIPAFVVDSFVTFMNECSKWANVSY